MSSVSELTYDPFRNSVGSARTWQVVYKLRWPGIEPGSTAWKAAMLTTIPPTHVLPILVECHACTALQSYNVMDGFT